MLKRLVKLAISILYFLLYEISVIIRRLSGKKIPGILVVLTYHSVKDNQRDKYARQMDEIIKTGEIVSADFQHTLQDGKYHVAVTFDDGYENILSNALPAMVERDITATIFVTTGYLGERPGWIRDRKHQNYNERIISEEQLIKLREGNCLFGSHTHTHIDLSLADSERLRSELAESRKHLERLLLKKIGLCSLPYGEVDRNRKDEFRKAGYERVYLNVPTYPASNTREYFLGRTDTSPDDWMLEYRLKLRGAYQWLPIVMNIKRHILGTKTQVQDIKGVC